MKNFKSFYEEMTFKVEVDGLPALFMSGNSPGQVKNHLRKLIKQPSMIKSVERQTKHNVKKMYRDKAQGKDIDESTEISELSPATVKSYKKKASDSNYKAASRFARVAGSPTSRKYKNKEMGKQDDIMRKRKAGLAMADKKVDEKLTIGKIRRAAYKTGKVLGDVSAVKKGKVAKRVKNRVVGKLLGKAVGKLGLFK